MPCVPILRGPEAAVPTRDAHDIGPVAPPDGPRAVRDGKVAPNIGGRVGLIGVVIAVALADGLRGRRIAPWIDPKLV